MVQLPCPPLPAVSIGELEAQYPQYFKALRMLIRDGTTLARIKRTVCWQRLALLHHCLPRQYRDPEMLSLQLRRQWRQGGGGTSRGE